MRNCLSNSTTCCSKKRTTARLRTVFSHLHACLTALRNCVSLESIFRRYQATCVASGTACSSASVWTTPLQSFPSVLRSWGWITDSAVRIMDAANVASTPSTLLPPGIFALRCPQTAANPSCQSWGSVTRRRRSTSGLAEVLRFGAR